jgi:DMSO/TMAO reductase YedYZ molybdopterin-dependent catalytic subunit
MNRRGWLAGLGATVTSLALAGCDKVTQASGTLDGLGKVEGLNKSVQRLLIGRKALAREFTKADISPDFRPNGSIDPADPDYRAQMATGFADWALVIDGLVENPMSLTLAELRAQPARTQITRHDCVEGWSSIGEWTGARLGPLLEQAKLKPNARYVVFHCADTLQTNATDNLNGLYYESLDLDDAFHPQTILGYVMNGHPLRVPHGAPIRLRVERQLGYKHAKYVRRIEAVESFDHIAGGKGGFWEDRGYEWYAGI